MSMRRYAVADVFTEVPLQGNQVAVFTDATGLSAEVMQRAAREMNLSETVFVFRAEDPNAHLRVRIFTPTTELPFAGHPVLGTAFVVGRAMGSNVVRLETGLGVIPVTLSRSNGGAPYYGEMEQRVPVAEPFEPVDELLAALGVAESVLPVEVYRNGPVFVYVALESEDAVAAVRPDLRALEQLGVYGSTVSRGRASAGRRGCSGRRWVLPRIPPPDRPQARWPCTWRVTAGFRSGPRSRSCRASRSGGGPCCALASRAAPIGSSMCSSAGPR